MREIFSLLLCCAAACWLAPPRAVAAEGGRGSEARLVAFGDLHGDLFRCRQLLRLANVTDANDRWIAGSSIVVQLGDVADRGRHPHKIYDLFASLEQQAKAAGGEFIFLIGNHELMNLLGEHSYVHPDAMAAFGGAEAYAAAFSPQGPYGSYILQHPVSVVRKGVVFVHAGITPAYAARGVGYINAELTKHFSRERHHTASKDTTNGEEHPFSDSDSPLWSRTILSEAKQGNCSLLRESLRLLSMQEVSAGRLPVHMMVGGHSVQAGGAIAVECNGSLVGADVGLSRSVYLSAGYVAYVELVPDASDPPRLVAQPRYPFGRGVRAPAPSLLGGPVQPPRCTQAVRCPSPAGGGNRELAALPRAGRGNERSGSAGLLAPHYHLLFVLAGLSLVCLVRLRRRRPTGGRHRGVCGH
ncbi:putative serine/threonine protein phosphatase [Trypanosoma conorhini]|uniref:Putative serine/threonine protein phosphatase n=1 Tax=Trypanosoma conorhini TaxID=83891 RepID=A0A422NWD1_9TRYP|nr:putative serine/threonine protein phosphatase [Trypanosoma conorhini]RNF09767.1 putative serine/threonine protein phosphatase [Trypanosoma conorhini]